MLTGRQRVFMIDKWFKEDLEGIFENHNVAVFIDESGDAEFLLQTIKDDYTLYTADSNVEDLHIKYSIERKQPTKERFLIYTHIKRDNLRFIREYCETNGCLEIRYLHSYIKDKVHKSLNLNINFPKEDLITAAKVSVGKDNTYWMNLCHHGTPAIFNMGTEILEFIHNPKTYASERFDSQVCDVFYRKVSELINQDYVSKPSETLAKEVVKSMLDGLAYGSCNPTLENVYQTWLDSHRFKSSFEQYLSQHILPDNIPIWKVNPNHPFRAIDEKWLVEIGNNIGNKSLISDYLDKIRQRTKSPEALSLGISFWSDILVLLEFKQGDINRLSSFAECIEFYTKNFYKLDTAIRNIYVEFLNKKTLLEPYQNLYKEHLSVFLEKWFRYFSDYKEEQTGILQRIIDSNSSKTAIIVGDGVSYEVAEQIATQVKSHFNLNRDKIIAGLPSETENNMSHIYINNGIVESVHANREKVLTNNNTNKSIEYIGLEEVSDDAKESQFLICTYKDIDKMGESLQQKALKHFPENIKFFAEKIAQLLSSGYEKVYLISDHGFVLTGLLSEADKISVSPIGQYEKAERYIRTVNRQSNMADYLEVKRPYKDFNYLYFARNVNPFKTPGVYGFSHGGASPQELMTPFFCWELSSDLTPSLSVSIDNKEDLKNITGELFTLRIRADKGAIDLFSMERKVYLVFFSNKTKIKESDVFSIKRGEIVPREYPFDGNKELNVHLLDAVTKHKLDHAIIKQNKERDLGGLL